MKFLNYTQTHKNCVGAYCIRPLVKMAQIIIRAYAIRPYNDTSGKKRMQIREFS